MRRMRKIGFISAAAVGLASLIALGVAAQEYRADPAGDQIRSLLTSAGGISEVLGEPIRQAKLLAEFYKDRNYGPFWSSEQSLIPQVETFLNVLRTIDGKGLNTEDYHLEKIESSVRQAQGAAPPLSTELRIALDFLLTDAFLHCGRHLLNGRINPRLVYSGWYNYPQRENDVKEILSALRTGDVENALKSLEPRISGYESLRQGLLHYRRIAASGGWPHVPVGEKLRKGDESPRVAILRRRLSVSGDLESSIEPADADLFDSGVEAALVRFQRRHGLSATGVLGASTLMELNASVEERIRQLELNLERLRWLPRVLGDRHIFVNVAGFGLEVIEDGQSVLEMRIVVGRDTEDQRTFVFTGKITYLEINPYWNVPDRIAAKELLPKAKINPDFLTAQGIRLIDGWGEPAKTIDPETIPWKSLDPERFSYRLRQDPGPENPLGRIKFMFPNEFSVYLHDTPDRHLFKRPRRTFSHGCIRIEKPIDLAEYLLKKDATWTREAILKAIKTRKRQEIRLSRPVPVYIFYMTAWADRSGSLHFREDVYKSDEALDLALRARASAPSIR